MPNEQPTPPSSTGDLFTQLEKNLEKGFAAVALVFLINQNKETELIFAGDGEEVARLAAMNALVRSGGNPVGYVGVTPTGKISVWPLLQYNGNTQIEKYLEEVGRQSRITLLGLAGVAEIHATPV